MGTRKDLQINENIPYRISMNRLKIRLTWFLIKLLLYNTVPVIIRKFRVYQRDYTVVLLICLSTKLVRLG